MYELKQIIFSRDVHTRNNNKIDEPNHCSFSTSGSDKGKIDGAVNDLKLISGQQPVITSARKSVAGFKLREGVNVGVKVTLRKQ